MSRLHFMLKYGTLDHAKSAIAGSNKELFGHFTAMNKLLNRMKDAGDPDYDRVRDEHFSDSIGDRIKVSHIVDSDHATPAHLQAALTNYPIYADRVARNKNADVETLHMAYKASFFKGADDGPITRRAITQHENAPKDLVTQMAESDPSGLVRGAAQFRLSKTMDRNNFKS